MIPTIACPVLMTIRIGGAGQIGARSQATRARDVVDGSATQPLDRRIFQPSGTPKSAMSHRVKAFHRAALLVHNISVISTERAVHQTISGLIAGFFSEGP